jgi:hypothetical protein
MQKQPIGDCDAKAKNIIAIVSTGSIAKGLGEKYDLDPRCQASLLDIFSCGFQGLSPLTLTPYCWYESLVSSRSSQGCQNLKTNQRMILANVTLSRNGC